MTRTFPRSSTFALLLILLASAAPAALAARQAGARPPDVAYSLAMPQPATHLFDVRVRVAGLPAGAGHVDLSLPVWTPGSYLVREFARNVQDFSAASSGRPLRWEKVDKNTWRVALAPGTTEVEATYRVYANELSVRTSHLDDSHGYVNGANVFMFVEGAKGAPVRVALSLPPKWDVATGLAPAATPPLESSAATRVFTAPDYDRLVDSPIEMGTFERIRFEALGKPHEIAIWGRGNYDAARLGADFKKIVEAAGAVFGGSLPYDRYVFITHLYPGGGGGLEHLNSTTIESSPYVFQKKESYRNFLELAAHEYFHLWLVKRIHPPALGPFDYSAENYTKMLWLMEGTTDFYASRLVLRAGLMTEDDYYKGLAKSIQDLQRTPGRRHMSLEEASYDAWVKYYRPNEHSANSQVSYYVKGAVVSAMLDLEIRGRTKEAKSLDDVLRYLWANYASKGASVPEDAVQPAVEAVAGSSFQEFFDRYVRGTAEIDYDAFLKYAGRKLVTEVAKDDARIDAAKKAGWLGANLADTANGTTVTGVLEDSPAWAAGLNTGDEVLAVDGVRTTAATLPDRLADRSPGDTINLTIFRRDQLRTLSVTLAGRPPDTYKIEKIEGEKKAE